MVTIIIDDDIKIVRKDVNRCKDCRHKFSRKKPNPFAIKKTKKPKRSQRCCGVSFGGSSSTRSEPQITKRRLANLFKTYDKIVWDKESITLTVIGYGDRPAYSIEGTCKIPGYNISVKVKWHSFTPGGGNARLYILQGRDWYRLCMAPLSKEPKVMKQIIDYYWKYMNPSNI